STRARPSCARSTPGGCSSAGTRSHATATAAWSRRPPGPSWARCWRPSSPPAGSPAGSRRSRRNRVSDEIGYADAMRELGDILDELERDDLDVDLLAVRVQRASELIQLCRGRIARAQADVDRIVTDLESAGAAQDGDD